MDTTLDTIDRLDLTVEDLTDGEVCVNCHGPLGPDHVAVEGWGDLCFFCHDDLWDVRMS